VDLRVTIVIVTSYAIEYISECLDSLSQVVDSGLARVIAVDNVSTDGTADLIKRKYPWVTLIESPFNNGFGAANNLALPYLETDYCLFFNTDAVLGKGCCEELIRFLDGNPDVGCVGPMVLDSQGAETVSHYPFMGLFLSIWTAAGLELIFPLNKTNNRWEIRRIPPDRASEVDNVIGAAMMIRREVLDEIGGFDERFFLYSEEEDLLLRMHKAGWKTYYDPSSSIIHRSGGTQYSVGLTRRAIAAANWSRYLYLKKHHSRPAAELSRVVWIITLLLRYLALRLRNRETVQGKLEGYSASIKSLLEPGWFDRVLRPKP